MNNVIETLINHRSDRSFLDKAIPDEILNNIIHSAYRAPTSVHSQQVSLIVTRDKATKAKLAELAGGQPWIARAPVFITFVLDMHKTARGMKLAGETQMAHQSIESIVSGSIDVGIALASAMAAAHSQGLGVVPIGGIRRDPLEVIKLLNLPKMTFPVNGLTLGYVDQPAALKPRLPLPTFRHDESYNSEALDTLIAQHNDELIQHWKTIERDGGESWSKTVGNYYKSIYFPNVLPALKEQGFGTEK
ncbi:NADPH-dependent oxidoreductase [[Erwinia] mediterraneensis]|uniref:NADPH-dependent oxidoreductase n=1 Tax=[Erwinia] mediterraneensis TaxID=2161819 RepID=UPI001030CFE4|nr:NADPH-dependent oxidoreductase [[Erwinia] mediterraneensis]